MVDDTLLEQSKSESTQSKDSSPPSTSSSVSTANNAQNDNNIVPNESKPQTLSLPMRNENNELKYLTVGELHKALTDMIAANPEVANSVVTAAEDGHGTVITGFNYWKRFVDVSKSTYDDMSKISVEPHHYFNVLGLKSTVFVKPNGTEDRVGVPSALRNVYREKYVIVNCVSHLTVLTNKKTPGTLQTFRIKHPHWHSLWMS